jgi:hypothetical protein
LTLYGLGMSTIRFGSDLARPEAHMSTNEILLAAVVTLVVVLVVVGYVIAVLGSLFLASLNAEIRALTQELAKANDSLGSLKELADDSLGSLNELGQLRQLGTLVQLKKREIGVRDDDDDDDD